MNTMNKMRELMLAKEIGFQQRHVDKKPCSFFLREGWGEIEVDTKDPEKMLADLKDWIDINEVPLLETTKSKRGKK